MGTAYSSSYLILVLQKVSKADLDIYEISTIPMQAGVNLDITPDTVHC